MYEQIIVPEHVELLYVSSKNPTKTTDTTTATATAHTPVSTSTDVKTNVQDKAFEGVIIPNAKMKVERPIEAMDEMKHVINLYLDGFTFDNGPFKTLSDPVNDLFILYVKSGKPPPELPHDINLQLIHHNTNYSRINSDMAAGTPSSISRTGTGVNINPGLRIKSCLQDDTTNLRIKLITGDIITLTVSQDATIRSLKQFIKKYVSNLKQVNKNNTTGGSLKGSTMHEEPRLFYLFPQEKLNFDDSTTLKEANILNCYIIQK